MKKKIILDPAKPIEKMSIDELINFLNAADKEFSSNFMSLNSDSERLDYLEKSVEHRNRLIQGNEEKFKVAAFFKEYEQLNFQYFSKKKAELTEEFVDNVRTDIRRLYSEVIEELLQMRMPRWNFDFKRMNEFKYFLNQIILNKYNYTINRLNQEVDEESVEVVKKHQYKDISKLPDDLKSNDEDEYEIEIKESTTESYTDKKTEFYKIVDGVSRETNTEVFEMFIKYSRTSKYTADLTTYKKLKATAKNLNSDMNFVIAYNLKYVLTELKSFDIGKQTYYNYFSFDDENVISDFIKHKKQLIDKHNKRIDNLRLETETDDIKLEISNLRNDVSVLEIEVKQLQNELNKKLKNRDKRNKLIKANKKVEFDKKFFINLGMYLQLDSTQLERFLNINGYSLESRNEQDTIIRMLYKNNYGIQAIDTVLNVYGYKSLRISQNRLEIMSKTSYELANEYLILNPDEIKLLSHTDRIKHYRNIETALNLIEKFLTNRMYNKEVTFMQLSLKHKFEFDEVEKARNGLIIGKGKVEPFGDELKNKIYEEFEKYDSSAAIRVDEIFKTKESAEVKTQSEWFNYHSRLLEELQNFEMYYADCKTEHPEERRYIKGSINRLIKRLEVRELFITKKLNEYNAEKAELEALSHRNDKQKNRLEKIKAYLDLLNAYEEPAMFYMRNSSNNEKIKFSSGVSTYLDNLKTVLSMI